MVTMRLFKLLNNFPSAPMYPATTLLWFCGSVPRGQALYHVLLPSMHMDPQDALGWEP